jgi:signal transduction histidine kinase
VPARAAYPLRLGAVALAYYVLARLGVSLAYHGEDASLVWPAHGVALAAVLLFGARILPAVFVASCLSGLASGAPLHSAALVAAGNTLGPLVGTHLLRRTRFHPSLSRAGDFLLLLVGGNVSAIIGATVGVATLTLRGLYPPGSFATHWVVWWAGDVAGMLTTAPFLLVWSRPPDWLKRPAARGEFLGGMALLFVASVAAFGPDLLPGTRYPLAYAVFPFAMWAAWRFEMHGAVTLTAIVAAVAIWQTLAGQGLFSHPSLQQTLIYLQAFLVVVTVSTVVLAALIGERRQLEREQREVLEREREARLEAQRAAAAREKMLAVVSHEVRNPLATVLLNSSAIADSPPDGTPTWVREAAESVAASAEQIEHLIRDLMDITRLEAGQIEFARVPCTPYALVEQAVQILQPIAADRGVRLEVRLPDRLPRVMASRERILQVFSNLVGNAIRATPPGGEITISGEPRGGQLLFRVRDSGPGISPERVAELLKPFWETPAQLTGSRGLGIPIARAIVRAHGGEFSMESRPGEGTRVSFTLPLRAHPAVSEEASVAHCLPADPGRLS